MLNSQRMCGGIHTYGTCSFCLGTARVSPRLLRYLLAPLTPTGKRNRELCSRQPSLLETHSSASRYAPAPSPPSTDRVAHQSHSAVNHKWTTWKQRAALASVSVAKNHNFDSMRVSSLRTDWAGFISDPKTSLRSVEQECPLARIQSLWKTLTKPPPQVLISSLPDPNTLFKCHQVMEQPIPLKPTLFPMFLFLILELTHGRAAGNTLHIT